MARLNSWMEPFHFHVNCIHFRGAVFVHVRRHNCVVGMGGRRGQGKALDPLDFKLFSYFEVG